jgi:hypothetical protein
VEDTQNHDRFRRWLTVVLVGLLCCHIILAGVFLLVPDAARGKVGRLYRTFTYIGPFFTSRNLSSSFHVVADVRHADETIESVDLTDRYQNEYNTSPWKYHVLLKKNYIRHVTGTLGKNYRRGIRISSDTLQMQLHQVSHFLNQEISFHDGDSVSCGFMWKKYYHNEEIYKTDTLFYLPIPIGHD